MHINILVFEGGMTLFGKNFNRIQKCIESKSVKEVIEFYYFWKKTSHYKQWKKSYRPDERDFPSFEEKD
jgi:N-acetylneuraminic acid mutarotase